MNAKGAKGRRGVRISRKVRQDRQEDGGEGVRTLRGECQDRNARLVGMTAYERLHMVSRRTPPIDRSQVADICERNDIAFLGLFGSHARGEASPESDVDLLVRFAKKKSLLELVRIERELAERLSRPVDLVTENSLSPYLKERIKAQVKSIYERER